MRNVNSDCFMGNDILRMDVINENSFIFLILLIQSIYLGKSLLKRKPFCKLGKLTKAAQGQ